MTHAIPEPIFLDVDLSVVQAKAFNKANRWALNLMVGKSIDPATHTLMKFSYSEEVEDTEITLITEVIAFLPNADAIKYVGKMIGVDFSGQEIKDRYAHDVSYIAIEPDNDEGYEDPVIRNYGRQVMELEDLGAKRAGSEWTMGEYKTLKSDWSDEENKKLHLFRRALCGLSVVHRIPKEHQIIGFYRSVVNGENRLYCLQRDGRIPVPT